jgi:hypothetical protein
MLLEEFEGFVLEEAPENLEEKDDEKLRRDGYVLMTGLVLIPLEFRDDLGVEP